MRGDTISLDDPEWLNVCCQTPALPTSAVTGIAPSATSRTSRVRMVYLLPGAGEAPGWAWTPRAG